ncbi:serine protease [Mycoplasmoides gallisepticum]
MKLNKIISVISLGVTGAAFPLSVVFNSYKKTNTKSLINKTTNGVIIKIKQIPKY